MGPNFNTLAKSNIDELIIEMEYIHIVDLCCVSLRYVGFISKKNTL